jgi:hypothetical protein
MFTSMKFPLLICRKRGNMIQQKRNLIFRFSRFVFSLSLSFFGTLTFRKTNRSYESIKMFEKCIRFDKSFVPAYLGLSKLKIGIASGLLLKRALEVNVENHLVRLELADWLYSKRKYMRTLALAHTHTFLPLRLCIYAITIYRMENEKAPLLSEFFSH